MDKYQYAIEQELEWLEEDIGITEKCISGEESTAWPRFALGQRLQDSRDEKARLQSFLEEYMDHEDQSV